MPNINKTLSKSVEDSLVDYLNKLDGEPPANLYDLVLDQIETPLIQTVMQHTNNNQSKAALFLGISRSTLRKKLSKINIQ
ncbi:MAG: Fis family transcriptional regulator [Gammaproteobacteria bacterium]|nr:Fis family transcriptional regulator [Gammaproteobacteria bacterium]